ncbi:MAG: DNA polymerase III subunit alpha [Ignavibacteriales bacterium CG_4_9_14_3_um_filter_34_10]|nr:MAG: DNA polymerase III subunit alpha [Ignavibacteriales bacterium CG_4_9_14_3_um_filter_34_10]
MSDFVHLHNHSHYSLQDAACTVESLVQATVENNMHAIALTDHGVMYGATEFYRKATESGIKPIIGVEAYIMIEGSRFDRGEKDLTGKRRTKGYHHIVLLAKNDIGYKNLIKLCTVGHQEGFYYKPRIDYDVLRKYKEGLICTSACLAGPISANLLNGNYDKALEMASVYKDIFDDDFYLELQDHGLDNDKIILEGMPKISKQLGIKLVATNDIHYIKQDHAIAHNILLLLGDKTGTADYKNLRYKTDQVYFKSADEMKKIFKKFPSAIENTLEIEEKVNFKLSFDGFKTPMFPIPKEANTTDIDEYFYKLASERLHQKFPKLTKEVEDRFNYEVSVIKQMGFSGYFLIVQDFINAAKNNKIPVGPGRGSAAGSLIAYVLGITSVNPIEYNLLFERFLNPARRNMPDIDVDFVDDKRGEVIEYTKNKYGENSVSQIITFNRLSSRAVIKDVGRVLKIPLQVVNGITKLIPSKFGKVYTIKQALDDVPELDWVKNSKDEKIQELIKYSLILEGMNRNGSKHASGVVIAPGDISDYSPLSRANDGELVTQYNMKELDKIGMLKMDFLGLKTLAIIRDTLELIKKNRNVFVDIENIPVDDKETYKLFWNGQTTGVFQFESGPMREYLKKLKPQSISELAAMNALYRPGPMSNINDFIDRKHGIKKIEYTHPILEPILKETYGFIVYQEQVIQIANKVGGLSLADADLLRRAMGKKDRATMAEQYDKFIQGAIINSIPEKIAKEIYNEIDKFADYGFNKSHAVAYSIVAYQTAYLKTYFLPEFLAANLSNEYGNKDKVTIFLEDCRKLKIKVLPPDVNRPSVFFDVKGSEIIFGLCAVKNVGVGAVEEIKSKREKLGRDYTSIYDLCANVDTRIVNKRVLEGLVLAGAFDGIKGSRAQNFAAIEEALNRGNKLQSSKQDNSNSLFGDMNETFEIVEPELPKVNDWNDKEILSQERSVLGFYLSDHPLHKFEIEYNSFATVRLGDPDTYQFDKTVSAVGVITELKTKLDKSGGLMAFFKLDDITGSCEGMMFSKTFKNFDRIIKEESTLLVRGKLESSGDAVKLQADEAILLEKVRSSLTKKIILYIQPEIHSVETVKELKTLLENHDGNLPLFVSMYAKGHNKDFYTSYKIELSDELISGIIKLIGENNIRYSEF